MTNRFRTDPVVFAQALLALEGVGRVTAGRLSRLFGSYAALRLFPREQILTRLKGVPKAAALVATLHDEAAMDEHLASAAAALQALQEKKITAHLTNQPPLDKRFAALSPSDSPLLLFAHGNTALLEAPLVALIGTPMPPQQPLLQALLATLQQEAQPCCLGIDEEATPSLLKRLLQQETAPVLIAAAGLGRLPQAQRGLASAAVRAGGLLIAPFPHTHGPFLHDVREQLTVQGTLAAATLFFNPAPDTAAWHSLSQTVAHGKPTFVVGSPEQPIPRAAQRLASQADLAWISLAVQAQAA